MRKRKKNRKNGQIPFRVFKYSFDTETKQWYKCECKQLIGVDLKKGDYEVVWEDNEEFIATFYYKKLSWKTIPYFVFITETGYLEVQMTVRDLNNMLQKGIDVRKVRGIWKYKRLKERSTAIYTIQLVKYLGDEEVTDEDTLEETK